MTAYTFDQLISFTRTSAATFVNSSGNIASTPPSRNLLTFTQDFESTGWTKGRAQVVPNVNPAAATLGGELVTNGNFAGGTTGWSVGNSNAANTTLAVTSGQLVVSSSTADGNGHWAQQAFTTVAGRLYVASVQYVSQSSTSARYIRVGSNGITQATGIIQFVNNPPVGTNLIYFVATAATTSIAVGHDGASASSTWDNVSVKEVVGGALTAPDGTPTADTMLEDTTASNSHFLQVNPGGTLVAGSTYTYSVYAKPNGRSWIFPAIYIDRNYGCYFNIATGTVGTTANAIGSITAVGDGWYRCSVTFSVVLGGGIAGYVFLANADNSITYTGNGTSGVFLWGAQLEQVSAGNLTPDSTELITNGDFSGGATTGWTATNSTLSVVSGQMQVETTGAAVGYAYQTFTTVTNRLYCITVDVNVISGTGLVAVGTGPGSGALYSGILLTGVTQQTLYFLASGTSTTVSLFQYTATAGLQARFDNVSVREITAITGVPTAYTRNVAGLFPPRFDYDPVTRAPRGLLVEDQRTNLLVRSENFTAASWIPSNVVVADNVIAAPSGAVTGGSITGSSSTANLKNIAIAWNTTTTGTYTLSVYLKAGTATTVVVRTNDNTGSNGARVTIDLSNGTSSGLTTDGANTGSSVAVTNAGNGWYRVAITTTYVSAVTQLQLNIWMDAFGNSTNTGTFYLWGSQAEAGTSASSYIPTVASQVTRSGDIAAIQALMFTSWFNATEGTMLVEADSSVPTTNLVVNTPFGLNDGTANNQLRTYAYLGRWCGQSVVTGVAQADMQVVGSYSVGVPAKTIFAYRVNDFALSVNGSAVLTDTSGTLPSGVNQAILGTGINNAINGHIRSVRYYPTRLTNAQLQALSA